MGIKSFKEKFLRIEGKKCLLFRAVWSKVTQLMQSLAYFHEFTQLAATSNQQMKQKHINLFWQWAILHCMGKYKVTLAFI